jgi:hypothetical protein
VTIFFLPVISRAVRRGAIRVSLREATNGTFAGAAFGGGAQGTLGHAPGGGRIRKRGGIYPCPLRHLVQ